MLNLLNRLPCLAIGWIAILFAVVTGCSSLSTREIDGQSSRQSKTRTPAPRPDWERTCPTLNPDSAPPSQPLILDLSDLVGGRIEELRIRWIRETGEIPSDWNIPEDNQTGTNPPGARRPNVALPPDVSLIKESENAPPHRIQISFPPDVQSPFGRLWFLSIDVRNDSQDHPSRLIFAIRGAGAEAPSIPDHDSLLSPIPVSLDPRIQGNDGGFAINSPSGENPVIRESLRILIGNEPLTLCSEEQTNPEYHSFRVEWLDPDRVVIRGLRDRVARSSSDALLRLFIQTRQGKWRESIFSFGGQTRRLFDPHDAILYFALTDRLPDGDSKNNQSLGPVNGVKPLNDWLGGDALGATHLIRSDYFNRLGVTCLALSPPYRQYSGTREIAAPNRDNPSNLLHPASAYRGLWTSSFGEPEPRQGTFEQWQQLVRTAHQSGLSILFGYCPWMIDVESPLLKEKPEWFSSSTSSMDSSSTSSTEPSSTSQSKDAPSTLAPPGAAFDRREWTGPFLRRASFPDDSEAVERMTGFGLWWIRTMDSDGLHCLGSDSLNSAFWRRLNRRLREEVARPSERGLYLLGDPLNPSVQKPFSTVSVNSPHSMNSPHSINPTPRNSQNPGTFTPLDSLGTLDGMVDYPLSLAIRRAFILQDVSLKDFHSILSHSLSMNSINAIPCLVSGTPDLPRWAPPDSSPNASSDSELDLAFTALFTLPGVPSIYYGDEIGMTGDGLPFNRAPLPPESSWTDSQRRRFDHTASLARLHREHPSLRRGDFLTLAVSDDAIVYCRTLWKESIVIALNRSPKEAILEITLPPNLKGARSLEALVGAPDNSIPIHNNQFELRLPPRRSGLWKVIGKQRPQQQ